MILLRPACLAMCVAAAAFAARDPASRRAPMASGALEQPETVLEGAMEVLIEDSDQGSRTLYFLIASDRRVPLRFGRAPANLTTGTRVRVRGRWSGSTLVVTSIERL